MFFALQVDCGKSVQARAAVEKLLTQGLIWFSLPKLSFLLLEKLIPPGFGLFLLIIKILRNTYQYLGILLDEKEITKRVRD
jgi:hypothetical protein